MSVRDEEARQRYRYTARGKWIPSNFEVHWLADDGSSLECSGCGRHFDGYALRGDLAPRGTTGHVRRGLNLARAYRHADACKGGS